jgi:hypothetical protein
MRHEVYRPTTHLTGLNARLGFGIYYFSPTAQTYKADCPGRQPLRQAGDARKTDLVFLNAHLVCAAGGTADQICHT